MDARGAGDPTSPVRAPLLLTGGPAAGKSTTARRLAEALPRAAAVDVDDLRQLVVGGHRAPWEGQEGRDQHVLGVENACDLARRFVGHGFAVVVADLVDDDLLARYRDDLPGLVAVRLTLDLAATRRRAATRPAYLTEAELVRLHDAEARSSPAVDAVLAVGALGPDAQVAAVRNLWTRLSG